MWRLASGNLVHLGWTHLALNAAGLVLIAALLGGEHRTLHWACLVAACSLGVGAGLLLGSPKVAWYAGLSGVGHGLVAAGGVALTDRRAVAGTACLCVLAGKLAWEQFAGAVPGSEAMIGATTVVDAHFYGAIAGLIGAAALRLGRRP